MRPFGKRHREGDPPRNSHEEAHAGHAAEIAALHRHVDALNAQAHEDSRACEARDAAATASLRAAERRITALEDKNRAIMSRLAALPPAAAVPEAAKGDEGGAAGKPARTRTAKAGTAPAGKDGAA